MGLRGSPDLASGTVVDPFDTTIAPLDGGCKGYKNHVATGGNTRAAEGGKGLGWVARPAKSQECSGVQWPSNTRSTTSMGA